MATISKRLPGREDKVRGIEDHFAVEVKPLRTGQHHALPGIANHRMRHQRFGDGIGGVAVAFVMPAGVGF
ncbi:hypothetical protein D3C76_1640620 [compost metagenome]